MPGTTKTINTASGAWDMRCELRGSRWQPSDFERFEFVSDWKVNGLKNLYVTHGLGVPLIAVRHSYDGEPVATQYYPKGLSFPVTVLLRPLSRIDPATGQVAAHNQCLLELYDPLTSDETVLAGRRVPLESDLTTPLAYFLSNPEMNLDTATLGLRAPAELLKKPADALLNKQPSRPIEGLYMVQPYEPGKIPVLMIHGLWSSPMTWMEMFNDLRSQPQIRDHFQFWFYLYPTGQPFWRSAGQLRRDLAQARGVLDPQHQEPALDQMVLIGHSMGGLVSRLQTIPSGDDFWRLVCQEPLSQVKTEPKVRERLQETYFFGPNPSIRRVVTIATPYRGSSFSDQTTQWLLDRLITLPNMLVVRQVVSRQRRSVPRQFAVEHSHRHRLAFAAHADLSGDPGQPAAGVDDVSQHRGPAAQAIVAGEAFAQRRRRRGGAVRQRSRGRRGFRDHGSGQPHDDPRPSGGRVGSAAHTLGTPGRSARPSRRERGQRPVAVVVRGIAGAAVRRWKSMATKTSFALKGRKRDAYLELIQAFPLASIKSERHFAAAEEVMDRLLAKGRLDDGEDLYLDALSDLVAAYEDEHHAIAPASDADMLRHLMEAKGVTQTQLGRDVKIAKSTISEVLAGKKHFSRQMICRFADYFNVDVSVLAANL